MNETRGIKMAKKLKNLLKLHEAVKSHPYRIADDKKYMKSYGRALRIFLDAALEHADENRENDPMPCFAIDKMYHDFSATIGKLHRDYITADGKIHIERCIGSLHCYAESGSIPVFYTWHPRGTFESMRKYVRYTLEGESPNQKYVDDITKEEIEGSLKEIKEWVKKHNGYSIADVHSKEWEEHLKKRLAEGKYK